MKEKKVLVVEDNYLNMKLVRSLLEIGNYKCLEAGDAETGLKIASEEKPDLILMDIQLPGMDGLTATKQLKQDETLQHIPVIALTSYAMKGDEERAKEAGCEEYISKPVDTRTFLKSLSRVLGKSEVSSTKADLDSKARILIVDDEPLNCKLLSGMMIPLGYDVLLASNGEEALDLIDSDTPDLVLLDIMMPGIDGYEVTKRVKNNLKTKHIPIILVTALSGRAEKIKGLEAGADEFINKPVNITELKARVKSLLKLKRYKEQLEERLSSAGNYVLEAADSFATNRGSLEISNIMIVEDNDKDIRLMELYLNEEYANIVKVKTGEEALSRIRSGNVDLVILDIILPQMDGFEVCRRIKENESTRNTQILVVTNLNDLESKVKGFETGADDFLVKPLSAEEIRVRAKALLKKKIYLDQLTSNLDTAMHAAITDQLTGLYNQSYFKYSLAQELKKTHRQKYPISVMMLDIDNFKQLNDTLGHVVGDRILKGFGELIQENIREVDVAARYGGDEFAILMPYVDLKTAQQAAERIKKATGAFCSQLESDKRLNGIGLSIGIASCNHDGEVTEEVIEMADSALYKAKTAGKGHISSWEETSDVDLKR